jgi:hypothetical protein
MGTKPKIVVAAKVLVYINNKLYGQVTSFSWNSSTPNKKIRTVDLQVPVELASTTSDITFNMGVLRTIGDGGIQGVGLVAPMPQLAKQKYFSILLLERTLKMPIFRADYCMVDDENWTLVAKEKMAGQVSCSAIIWTNETDNQ